MKKILIVSIVVFCAKFSFPASQKSTGTFLVLEASYVSTPEQKNTGILSLFRRTANDDNVYEEMFGVAVTALATLLAGFFAIFAIIAETSKFPRPLFRRLIRDRHFYLPVMVIGVAMIFNLVAMGLKPFPRIALIGVFLFFLALGALFYLGWVLINYLGRRDIVEGLAKELSKAVPTADE